MNVWMNVCMNMWMNDGNGSRENMERTLQRMQLTQSDTHPHNTHKQ